MDGAPLKPNKAPALDGGMVVGWRVLDLRRSPAGIRKALE